METLRFRNCHRRFDDATHRARRRDRSDIRRAHVENAGGAALELGAPTYRFLKHYLDRRAQQPQLALRQFDPLIRRSPRRFGRAAAPARSRRDMARTRWPSATAPAYRPVQSRWTPPRHWPVLMSPPVRSRWTPHWLWPVLTAAPPVETSAPRRPPPSGTCSPFPDGRRSRPRSSAATTRVAQGPGPANICHRSRRLPSRRGTTVPTPSSTSSRLPLRLAGF
jgi:hypothetical protein